MIGIVVLSEVKEDSNGLEDIEVSALVVLQRGDPIRPHRCVSHIKQQNKS